MHRKTVAALNVTKSLLTLRYHVDIQPEHLVQIGKDPMRLEPDEIRTALQLLVNLAGQLQVLPEHGVHVATDVLGNVKVIHTEAGYIKAAQVLLHHGHVVLAPHDVESHV